MVANLKDTEARDTGIIADLLKQGKSQSEIGKILD